jgi:CBS domain containing-hemolysin-like protein
LDNDLELLLTLVSGLAGAALASSVEAALVGVTAARVRGAIAERVPHAERLRFWVEHPGRVLTTLHLLRLSCVLSVGWAAWALASRHASGVHASVLVPLVALGVLAVAHLFPRTLAKRHPYGWAVRTVGAVRALSWLLLPLTVPTSAFVRLFTGRSGSSGRWGSAFWTPDEIGQLAADAEASALGKRGTELLRSIIEFSDTVIREIMVPRTDMVAIEVSSSPEEVLRTIVEARHSRVPIFEGTIDDIVGVLHVKDLFHHLAHPDQSRAGFDLRGAARPTFYVPEVMKISELLREFQRRKTHMAIVVDEYGGTSGVVTLEDIIEEIVGDIQDEYDVDEKQYRVLADNKIIADGRVSIWDLGKALAVEFPSDSDYETLAGFLVARAGYLPRPGTVITWGGLRFTVKEADDKRVGTVEIEPRREAPAS